MPCALAARCTRPPDGRYCAAEEESDQVPSSSSEKKKGGMRTTFVAAHIITAGISGREAAATTMIEIKCTKARRPSGAEFVS